VNSQKTISFGYALMLGVNTIVGAGFLVNIYPLIKTAGILGFLGYWCALAALLPVMIVIARFAQERPIAAGIYHYPKDFLAPQYGFLSGWSYFLGKCASVATLTHAMISFFMSQGTLPSTFSALTYDAICVILFGFLNIAGVSVAGRIQWLFTALKSVPFISVLLGSIYFISTHGIPNNIAMPHNISLQALLPLALFAFSGFESICAIGHLIENPKKNAFRVIMAAGFVVLTLYTLLQVSITLVLGGTCTEGTNPLLIFSSIVFGFKEVGLIIVNCAYISVLSGIFGNLANNSWNLHALAKDGFFPLSHILTRNNKHGVPWVALLLKIGVILFFLSLTQQQVPLTNIAVAGITLSYLLNLLAALKGKLDAKINQVHIIIPLIGTIFCLGIIAFCLANIATHGLSIPFISLFLVGSILAASTKLFLAQKQ
jgi:amino acid transporter